MSWASDACVTKGPLSRTRGEGSEKTADTVRPTATLRNRVGRTVSAVLGVNVGGVDRVRWLPLLATLLALGGCTAYNLIEPTRVNIGRLYSVEAQRTWSRVVQRGVELWTVDGPLLQAVRFFDVHDGDSLLPVLGDRALPEFRTSMTASEVQEFVADTVAALGGARVETRDLEPLVFGSWPGFRFELGFVNEDGLEMDALVAGAVHDQRLHLIVYTGARLHYFERYRGHVERLIGSVGPPV